MLKEISVRLVEPEEEPLFQELMQTHHYLGPHRKIGEALWYVATLGGVWVALLTFAAAALKLAARDQWIGWSYRQHYARLRLVANNTRFCVLPEWRVRNLASRVLSLCERRISQDWNAAFGHPILLLETFVDRQHRGTLYVASNWTYVGDTQGYRRVTGGAYSSTAGESKKVFVHPLHPQARARLCQANVDPELDGERRMLSADHLRALPAIFRDVADPRGSRGRRYPLSCVLAIAAAAHLCGVRGYKATGRWAGQLAQTSRHHLRCCWEQGNYRVPHWSVIREILVAVDQEDLENALRTWNERFAIHDVSLTLHAHALCVQDGRTVAR